MRVVAPGKTPRVASDRVKTDRKDAELLARLLLAGQLKPITVPSVQVEAARELTRAHDAVRRDLMTARHRVSKMLLRHGIVYPDASTWTTRHRSWLARQQFADPVSDLAFADLLAGVDGLTARKAALAERISRLAVQGPWWPTVARLRAFRGIDTLTALTIDLELCDDWQRFPRPRSLAMWLGLTPSLQQSGQSARAGSITKTGSTLAAPAARRGRLALQPPAPNRRHAGQPPGRPARPHPADRKPRPAAPAPRPPIERARGKHGNVIVVAAARELACFLWAAATTD